MEPQGNHRSIAAPSSSRPFLLFICYLGFISLGLPDTLIGVAWPSVRETFGLQQASVSWIFIGGGCSYFLSSFFAGRFLKIFNIGVLLALSSGLVALSGFNYWAAPIWTLFALGALLHGLGSGAIDAGLNHYVAHHFSARHMNWLHACYSLGAMLGPILMTAAITRAQSFRLGYLIVAIILSVLSVLFFATRKKWNNNATPETTAEAQPAAEISASRALQHPIVWLQIIVFFIYTGLEVALGQWAFTVLTDNRNIPPATAGGWVTLYWAAILAGRILFGFIVDRIGIDLLIRLSTLAALVGAALFTWNPHPLSSPIALALSGIGLAVIFPLLMTRTPQRLGKPIAAHAIGFQVAAAMLGAAALPSLAGLIAQHAGLHLVPATLLAMSLALLLLHELLVFATAPRTQPAH